MSKLKLGDWILIIALALSIGIVIGVSIKDTGRYKKDILEMDEYALQYDSNGWLILVNSKKGCIGVYYMDIPVRHGKCALCKKIGHLDGYFTTTWRNRALYLEYVKFFDPVEIDISGNTPVVIY